MKAREFAKLVQYAEIVTFDESFSFLSYNAAEKIHQANANGAAYQNGNQPVLSGHEAAALIKYQAMQMNGEWDAEALIEIQFFMRIAVLYDMDLVADVIVKRPKHHKPITINGVDVVVTDDRFSKLEA